jgi:hypothetical protein
MAGLLWMMCCVLLQEPGVEGTATVTGELRAQRLEWEALRAAVAGGEYRAISGAEYEELRRLSGEQQREAQQRPWIRRAEYRAEFRGIELVGGR